MKKIEKREKRSILRVKELRSLRNFDVLDYFQLKMSKHNGSIFDYLKNGSISKGIKSLLIFSDASFVCTNYWFLLLHIILCVELISIFIYNLYIFRFRWELNKIKFRNQVSISHIVIMIKVIREIRKIGVKKGVYTR